MQAHAGNPMPQISVIIPIFNVERYIADCLSSVVTQSLCDIEIICIDDCSTDNSMGIVQELAARDARIHILRHERNRGQGPGRNTGLGVATGEYIFFLDSDDLIGNEHSLRDLLHKAETSACDICIGQSTPFPDDPADEGLQRWCRLFQRYIRPMPVAAYRVTEYNFLESLHNFPGIIWGRLYRRDFLARNGITFIDANIVHQDEGFHSKTMAMLPLVTVTNVETIKYRQRQGSMIRQLHSREAHLDELFAKAILADVCEWLRQHSPRAGFFISQLLEDNTNPSSADIPQSPAELQRYPSVADFARPPDAKALAELEKALLAYPLDDHTLQTQRAAALVTALAHKTDQHDFLPPALAPDKSVTPQRGQSDRARLLARNRKHLPHAFYLAYPAYNKALKTLWRTAVSEPASIPNMRYEHLPRNVETFCLAWLTLCG